MGCNLLKKFLINLNNGKQVQTVPFDCGAKHIQNEKILNHINYFKSAAYISLMPDFLDQINTNKGKKGVNSSIINVKINEEDIFWDESSKAFVVKFKSVDSIISVLSKHLFKEFFTKNTKPWDNLFIYSDGNSYSLTKKSGFNQIFLADEKFISRGYQGITKNLDQINHNDLFCVITDLIKNRSYISKILNKIPPGFSQQGLLYRSEKLTTCIEYIDSILISHKFLSIGRFSSKERPVTPKSFPFVLNCKLDLTQIESLRLIVRPIDAVRIPNCNIFTGDTIKLSDSLLSRYSSNCEHTVDYSIYDSLNKVGQGCREDIFQQDTLVNYSLWDKIIYTYLEKFQFSKHLVETNNLIFFNPSDLGGALVDGYSLVYNSIVDIDLRNKVADSSVLFDLINSPIKHIDKSFNAELSESLSVIKSGTTYKGFIKSRTEPQYDYLDLFQKNFLYKSINYLSESPSKYSTKIATLNAPPNTLKYQSIKTYIASQIVESTYASLSPEVIFTYKIDSNDSLVDYLSWGNIHKQLETPFSYSVNDRWVEYKVNDDGTIVPLDYYIDLTKQGLFKFESIAKHLIKNHKNLESLYLDHAYDATQNSLLSTQQLEILENLSTLGMIPKLSKSFIASFSVNYNRNLPTFLDSLQSTIKLIYESYIHCESAKREYLEKVAKIIDIITKPYDISFSKEELKLLENEQVFYKIKSDSKSFIDSTTNTIINKNKISEDILNEIKQLKERKANIDKIIKSNSKDIKILLEEIAQGLKGLLNKSTVSVTLSGGKASMFNKFLNKYKSHKNFENVKHIVNQHVNTSSDNVSVRKINESIKEVVANYCKNSPESSQLSYVENEIYHKQEHYIDINKEIEELKIILDNHKTSNLDNDLKIDLINKIHKNDEDFVKVKKCKDDFISLCTSISKSGIVSDPYLIEVFKGISSSLDVVGASARIKADFELVISSVFDSLFKVLLFNLSMRWNEGKFIQDLPNLSKGYSSGSVKDRFNLFSRIFPLFVTTPSSIAQSLMASSPSGFCAATNVIDTLIVDNANMISVEYGIIGFCLAKKALVIGDRFSPGPRHKISESMDISLSTKVLDSGYFLTPQIQDNIFNCHKSSILSLSQFYTPWHPFPDLLRGDYLFSVKDTPIEIVKYSDSYFYNNNLYFKNSPIYFSSGSPLYHNIIGETCLNKCSLGYSTNPKLSSNGVYSKPWVVIKNDGEFNKAKRINLKEIVDILNFIDINYANDNHNQTNRTFAIITPFKTQADKIREIAIKFPFKNKDLYSIRSDFFSISHENSIYIGDLSHLSNFKVDTIIYSNVYDENSINSNNYFERDPTLINFAISCAKKSFVIFVNSNFMESICSSELKIASLFKFVKTFTDDSST